MVNYLAGLNEQQKEAVQHINGPLMIIAGAGSGKTKVLTTRIAHLMNNGVDAFHILALTFTNKAAAEMKDRIEKILGNNEARNLYIGTFHSVFARILRAEAKHLGYPANFTIYDTEDSRSVIKTVVREMGLDEKEYKPAAVGGRISWAKNALIYPDVYAEDPSIQQEDARAKKTEIGRIFASYCERCFRNGAMDFDDLLLKMYELLSNFPDILHKYQHKFRYVLIDEYQDTNPVQYRIAKLLAAVHENICVVGDDAQSIYSFRGATIENILQFRKDYDDVHLIKLEQNYRSSAHILEVANEVIKKNEGQIHKKLWTENISGELIRLVRTMTDNDEGKMAADAIQEQKLRYHFSNSDFAILYRTNAQSRSFEESLRRMGIPCKIYGGVSFYQRKEVKDLLAYLRVTVNPADEESLKRIINYPVRGIGKTTIEKMVIFANEKKIPVFEVMSRAAEFGFRAGTLQSISNFVTMIRYFQSILTSKNAYDVAIQVGKHTELVKELFNDKSAEGLDRYNNLQELLNSIKEWTESPSNDDGELGDKSLGAYLQQIALHTDADDDSQNSDVVRLMTIHAAKGLEFECVFVGGLEENLFPGMMSINTREDLEEERRLFYVAITRAKQKLWLSYANTRYRYGQLIQNDPSRFLDEIPEKYLDKSYSGANSRAMGGWGNNRPAAKWNGGWGDYNDLPSNTNPGTRKKPESSVTPSYFAPTSPKVVEHHPSANFIPSDTSRLEVGQEVEHQKFGFGKVARIEGSSHNPVATIVFNTNGEKKIMLNYAKLRIVGEQGSS